ncbi:MAG: agmatinase family protein [Longimicrobiaceae bacterium]
MTADPLANQLPPDADGSEGVPVLLGLPYDGGIPTRPGARFGPRAIREALASFSARDGSENASQLLDLGDLELPTTDGADAHRRIEEAAGKLFSRGGLALFLGGDHGCTGSVIRGLARARPGIRLAAVSIDAHLDVREYRDEHSISSGTSFRRALESGVLDGPDLTVIGVRGFANARRHLEWAGERGVRVISVEEVEEKGVGQAAAEVRERLVGADALYLSADIDAVDAAFAPAASAAGPGGLTSREVIALVRELTRFPRLAGMDVMEVSPPYDSDGRTAKLAARLLLEGVGGWLHQAADPPGAGIDFAADARELRKGERRGGGERRAS